VIILIVCVTFGQSLRIVVLSTRSALVHPERRLKKNIYAQNRRVSELCPLSGVLNIRKQKVGKVKLSP
jgi:hypothetical protein